MRPRTILCIAWAVALVYAWPGFLLVDSADQLLDSRTGTFTDWHPVMMTGVWSLVGHLFAGPAPMLVLQTGLLLFGSYALLRRTLTDHAAAIAAAAVTLFPPILATQAVITSEAQLASFLVAAAAALSSTDRRARYAGIVLAVIACGMRPGALVALLPLVLVCGRPWHRALLLWLATTLVSLGLSHVLVDARTHRTEIADAIADISGTTHTKPALPTSDAERDALLSQHWQVALDHPGAFLSYRWRRVFARHKRENAVYTKAVPSYPRDAVGLRHMEAHSLMQRLLTWPVRLLSHTPLFRPLVYFVLAIVLGIAGRRSRLVLGLTISAVAYQLSLLVVGARGEFRDSHWLLVATALAFTLVLVQRASRDVAHRGGD
ncbi:MAG: hypothetical protein JO257_11580 [Deltaproteobacteria bacterium]|nr:hypothetical protein [Deltaproteobacteria bacterium]